MQLTGFKSFVEPTELVFEKGLTGIVGPNGCGKSNLVEALRWAMGETSARRVRGSEMDDVIFAGTAARPARNLAEVVLTLDNSERRAPAEFNDADELDVIRRIERGAGSAYRVNGNDTRARDVQTLFADASTGARSTALVSQGRIGSLIAAKPAERRLLLEEASGITGLHARRHEAELRLRAAETNLKRLQDVIGTYEEQHRQLKRQARQASRYRNLSDRIRKQQAILLHLRWIGARSDQEKAAEELDRVADLVAALTQAVAAATTAQSEAAAAIPDLRTQEAETAAVLRHLNSAVDALDAEEHRITSLVGEIGRRIAQIDSDTARERDRVTDAGEAIARLDRENASIEAARSREAEDITGAKTRLDAAEAAVAACQEEVDALVRDLVARETREAELRRQLDLMAARRLRLGERHRDAVAEREAAKQAAESGAELEQARAAAERARLALEDARARLAKAETETAAARAEENARREAHREADSDMVRLRAERKALSELLTDGDRDRWQPLIDDLEVDAGYEVALGTALGDDLNASTDGQAPVHWREIPSGVAAPELPPGIECLADHVRGPAVLDRRLCQVGVVDSAGAGAELHGRLRQGQRLVSRDGGLWRWDGFAIVAGAPTAAANRLAQRNRLAEVVTLLAAAERRAGEALGAHREAAACLSAAEEAERGCRSAIEAADRAFQEARDAVTAAADRSADARLRAGALDEALQRIAADQAELDEEEAAVRSELAAAADHGEKKDAAERRRRELATLRAEAADVRSAHDRLHQASETRRHRLQAISDERLTWLDQAGNAEQQLERLSERSGVEAAELGKLEARPAEIAAERAALLERTAEAERARDEAADSLAAAESRLDELNSDLRTREARLAETREDRVRREAAVDHTNQALVTIAGQCEERIGCGPENALELTGLAEGEALPSREDAETRLERLERERGNIGPINLRAEQEAQELDDRIREMETERDDLVAAIGKLRRGISELNREGRGRLLAAFDDVDRNFREVFIRLVPGGRAHLKLTDSEDPLEAGLEVYASPPGKKLQTMSLLSGGEQALAALALLFAVFLTNPAPICVLDEVDAPLDDSNVDRFCMLLEDLADRLDTRFLLVTHHRLTMARMDRLYGVTMAEPGVSQLVSVDLRTADRIRDAA